MISSLMIGGNSSMPASAMLLIEATPFSTPSGLRLRWMRMWIETGMPSSCAAAKKGSSCSDRSSSPEGQVEMITPRKPSCLQRFISSIMDWTPRFGICARPKSRSGSTEQNSCASQLL